MSALTLYSIVPSRGSIVRWMLEEVGEPYELRALAKGESRQPDFLRINPMGKVPTLVHDGVVITEAAAICLHLADAFPRAGLSVPIGDRRRGPFLKWLFFGPSCLEPAILDRAFPRAAPADRGALGWGDYDTTLDVLADGVSQGPYLMGEQFTAADVVIGSGLRWGTMFKLIAERPAFSAYLGRLATRPALQRADAKDRALMA